MTTKFGFTKMSIAEFETWIASIKVARTLLYIQEHHTWNPSYVSFDGDNHFELQQGMKTYHVNNNGWMDIGQHFTTFPDGSILTGRSLESTPACIYGNNSAAICIENLGNFDEGKDAMTQTHRETIVRMTAALCKRFSVPANSDKVVYHHWFNLTTGERNNGTKNNKTCPGTNFFGGNKVSDCESNFLPLVKKAITGASPVAASKLLKYVMVTADSLNVRIDSNAKSKIVPSRVPAVLGSILRVYQLKNGWYRISSSESHWVNGNFTIDVKRATVDTSTTLNVRSGPSTVYPRVGSLANGQEVFISQEQNGWAKISTDNKWVKQSYLKF